MNKVKIVLNNDFVADYNFGFPCIMHGVEHILDLLYGAQGYELIAYTCSEYRKEISSEYKAVLKHIDSTPTAILKSAIYYRFGVVPKNEQIRDVLQNVKDADLVVGLYPIVWAGTFFKHKKDTWLEAVKMALGHNLLMFVGKLYGKKSVKTVCSIGPIEFRHVKRAARISSNYLWDKVYAREKESAEALLSCDINKKKISVVPDLANVMEYAKEDMSHYVGLSVSFQIIQQWIGSSDYISDIAKLGIYILEHTDCSLLLIPNEYPPNLECNDISVAYSISVKMREINSAYDARVHILDVENLSCKKVKNTIASLEVMVASRYHSCVAALSSAVPTLIIGWHWKYQELLELYKQEEWCIPTEQCNVKLLEEKFADMWRRREEIHAKLEIKKEEIYKKCIEAGKEMFSIT